MRKFMTFHKTVEPSEGKLLMADSVATLRAYPTVSQLVTAQPGRARVFEQYGIPYCCCAGEQTVPEACAARNLNPALVLGALQACDQRGSAMPLCAAPENWSQASLSDFIEHIVQEHHHYLRGTLPRLSYLIDRLANNHGALFNELWEIQGLFEEFKTEIEHHLEKEEQMVFPSIKRLEKSLTSTKKRLHFSDAAPLISPIYTLKTEHPFFRDMLFHLRQQTDNFCAPEATCNIYRVVLHELAALETELLRHMHEEEELLFPRAIALAWQASQN